MPGRVRHNMRTENTKEECLGNEDIRGDPTEMGQCVHSISFCRLYYELQAPMGQFV